MNPEGSNDNPNKVGHTRHQRFNRSQILRLEESFQANHLPDHDQQRQLCEELGFEPHKIKFWFQNRRTQEKAFRERADGNALQWENRKLGLENLYASKALSNSRCRDCLCGKNKPACSHQSASDHLREENAELNARLLEIYENFSQRIGIPANEIIAQLSGTDTYTIPPVVAPGSSADTSIPTTESKEVDKLIIALNASDEVTRLLKYNGPMWKKDKISRKYVFNHETYKRIYPKTNLNSFYGRLEASKDDGLVRMAGKQLVEMFLDADKWADFFQTIVVKAETIQELESGTPETRNGCLKLMYEKLHVLSPLVAPREFYFLRHCQQVNEGVWVITDVADDNFSKEKQDSSPCGFWRLPSGYMIEDMSNGSSKVTWMEHMKIDGRTKRHRLYRDVVSNDSAYEAERWLLTLKRTCERFAYSMVQSSGSSQNTGGQDLSPENRRSIMNLSRKMVKIFSECVAMNGKAESEQPFDLKDGAHISTHRDIQGQPDGIIITATSSIRLPLPFQTVFEFLLDNKTRTEWDVLSSGEPTKETTNLSYGTHRGNQISIYQFCSPDNTTNVALLQETFMDKLGSLLVYAPIEIAFLDMAMCTDHDYSSSVLLVPTGFLVSPDGHFGNEGGASTSSTNIMGSGPGCSILTMAFQFLTDKHSEPIDDQTVAKVKAVTDAAMQKIKSSLGCSDQD